MNLKALGLIFLFSTIFLFRVDMNPAAAIELAPQLHKNVLENGLTSIVKETPGTKAVTVQFWVKAGSAYEGPNEGGITHLIEHMIFKGTPSRPAGGLARAIEEVGGSINAYTSYDYTVYHATLSARYCDLALEVLSDAVLHATFDPVELEREKKVVLEEIAMRDDQPQTLLYEQLMAHSYLVHPYRLPIIGTRQSVASFTRDDILRYVEQHYQPENITVVVVGDVRAQEVNDKIRELLGGLPRGNHPNPVISPEPARQGVDFFKLSKDIKQTYLLLSLPTTPFDNPDTPVLDVIATLLGHGESSRLYHRLRDEKGLVYRIGASSFTPKDQGLLEVSATLDSTKVTEALQGVLDELFKLKYQPVQEEELARVKRNLESDFVFGQERVEGQARILGSFEFLTGDPRADDYLSRVRSVTREDVLRVAAKYIKSGGLTVGVLTPPGKEPSLTSADLEKMTARAESIGRNGVPSALVENSFLPGVYHYVLPNGLRLLVREDPRVDTVSVRAVMPGGLRGENEETNGAFTFISALLPKGTKDLNARQLALKIADMAGSIDGFSGKNTFGLNGDFLARFFEPGLRLMRDIIRQPAFDPAEAEKIRPELLARLRQQQDSLPALTFLNFNQALFQGHPYGLNPIGSAAAFRRFTVSELRSIYEKEARPDHLVLAVSGAVKADEVHDLVVKMFGDWQAETVPAEAGSVEEMQLPPEPPSRPDLIKLVRDREQTQIIIGFLGTTLASPDRYPLEILDTVLSGQSGRLFSDLRDKQSLAYSLSSFSQLGVDTGSFGVYVATSPDKKDQAIKAVWKELFRVQQEPISQEELSKARNLLISHYELGLQTHGAQALEMALNETYGLGQDFGNRYIKALDEVTPAQVMAVAQRYIMPDHYVMVTAGAEGTAAPDGAQATATAPAGGGTAAIPPAQAQSGSPANAASGEGSNTENNQNETPAAGQQPPAGAAAQAIPSDVSAPAQTPAGSTATEATSEAVPAQAPPPPTSTAAQSPAGTASPPSSSTPSQTATDTEKH